MKIIALPLALILITLNTLAQNKPVPPKKPVTAKKPVVGATKSPVLMKNALDSFSYALGLSMAGFYKEQGVININTALVTRALKRCKSRKTQT